ncbi:MAG TPA: hypothetical protein DCY51_10070 [Bacteroidetes bacterium]|nr:hypothetical protein [Bacteroidota bacterium]
MKKTVIIFSILLGACSPQPEGDLVAEAFGNKLYSAEIAKVVGDDLTFEDSVFITKEYINVWLSKQVLLNKADEVLTAAEKDKSKALEQYRLDLLTYEVLNKLANQQLDTSVDEEELQEYYDNNSDEFELSQNILKIIFYKIPKSTKDANMLWSSFKAGDESVTGMLKDLAKENGNYYDDDQSWVYFDDILKEIPINTYNQEHYLNNNKYIQLDDGDMVYFIKILDFKIRSTTSPFSMERSNIRDILVMKRQQKLVRSIETKLLDEAYSKKQIRTF